jgi:hypothetical protein
VEIGELSIFYFILKRILFLLKEFANAEHITNATLSIIFLDTWHNIHMRPMPYTLHILLLR